jgi:hypothetical protein
VIFANSAPAALAAKRTTTSIPIVLETLGDSVQRWPGLASRPTRVESNGNLLTGSRTKRQATRIAEGTGPGAATRGAPGEPAERHDCAYGALLDQLGDRHLVPRYSGLAHPLVPHLLLPLLS